MNISSWGVSILYVIGLASVIGMWFGLGSMDIRKLRERMKINRQLKFSLYNKRWLENKWLRKYHFLLSSAIRRYELEHFSKVVSIQVIAFLSLSGILLLIIKEFVFVILIALILAFGLPVAFLFFLHKQKSNVIQNEIVEVSVILLQEYQKNHNNMLYALKGLIGHISGYSQAAYAKLFARMHDDDEMKVLAAESFAFQLGHFRSRNLSSYILRACKEGTDVADLLEGLIEDISEFNKRTRDAETESRETAIIGFAPLPLLIILHIINDRWLIPGGNAFHYQFQTSEGLKSFMISVVFGIIGIGLALLVKRPKKT